MSYGVPPYPPPGGWEANACLRKSVGWRRHEAAVQRLGGRGRPAALVAHLRLSLSLLGPNAGRRYMYPPGLKEVMGRKAQALIFSNYQIT